MNCKNILKSVVVGSTYQTLIACSGSSGVIAPAGATTSGVASFTASYDTTLGAVPKQVPLTGSAFYTGEVLLNTGTAVSATEENHVIGDLDINVSFKGGANPIPGAGTNFTGKINGADATVGGGLNAITTSKLNIPGQGAATFTSLVGRLDGDLNDATDTINGAENLNLQGNFTSQTLKTAGVLQR